MASRSRSSRRRRALRPRGWVRHYAGLLFSPAAPGAVPLLFERRGAQRLGRGATTLGAGIAQRCRPTRPRMRALAAAPGGRAALARTCPPRRRPGPTGRSCTRSPPPPATSTARLCSASRRCRCPCTSGTNASPRCSPSASGCARSTPGDRVIVPFQITCGACPRVRRGAHRQLHERAADLDVRDGGAGAGHWGGAFAEELAVPYADAMLVPLPAGDRPRRRGQPRRQRLRRLPPHRAPPARAARRGPRRGGAALRPALRTLALFGCSVPLYAGLIARALGARTRHPRRRPPRRPRARRAPRLRGAAPAPAAPPPARAAGRRRHRR